MVLNYTYAIISVVAVSAFSLVGLFTLSVRDDLIKKYVFAFVSIAVGALLGDSFLHLIPQSIEISHDIAKTGLIILAGIICFFIIEKVLHWHHHHGIEDRPHNHRHAGKLILISDGVHNFIDGTIIATSYLISIPVGVATTIAVLLHEIPQEIGDFGVLLHSGYTKGRALWLNFLSALAAFAGLLLIFILGNSFSSYLEWFIPLAAGGFIYVALSDLIPELHKTRSVKSSLVQLIGVLIGIGAMMALLVLE